MASERHAPGPSAPSAPPARRGRRFGDVAWATATGGQVVGWDHLAQLSRATAFQLRAALARAPRAAGFASPAEVDRALAETALPATPLVAACHALVREFGPPALAGHVVRTYAWGTLLGLRDGLRWDRELFAAAALLHDVALARRQPQRTCFAHDGALQADDFLRDHGVEPARRAAVADAICLHLRTAVPVALGVEAHLVHAGAGVDVVGARHHELPAAIRRAVLDRDPPGELVAFLTQVFADESRRHPRARIGRWMRLGFGARIRRNPLWRTGGA